MTPNLDIYRSAHALIQQHGEAAAIKSGATLVGGSLAALNEIERKEPAVGERRH